MRWSNAWLHWPGGDLLFHVLGRSTIGAEGFHGRVRDGIGCFAPRYGHQAIKTGGPALSARPIALRRQVKLLLHRKPLFECLHAALGLALGGACRCAWRVVRIMLLFAQGAW